MLLALFAVSVAVRVPNLGRPLGRQHEWLSAQVLRVHEIWDKQGLVESSGLLVHTYPGNANRYISNHGRLMSQDGIEYHTSYPATAFVVPYLIFKVLGIRSTAGTLQMFSIGIHLLAVLLLWMLVRYLLRDREPKDREPVAALVAATYAFAPIALWMHANVYWPDMAAQPLFIAAVYAAIRVASTDARSRTWGLALVSLVFLTVLTEWIGVFLAAVAAGFFSWRRPRRWGIAAALVGAATLGAALHLAHLSLVDEQTPLWEVLRGQILNRAGLAPGESYGWTVASPRAWAYLGGYYGVGYAGSIAFAALAVLVHMRARAGSESRGRWATHWRHALVIAAAPAALFHLALFNLSAIHSFTALKGGIAVVLASAWIGSVVGRRALVSFFAVSVLVSVGVYFLWFSRPDPPFEEWGREISARAAPGEVVFIAIPGAGRETLHPAIVLAAGRNIAHWEGEADARRLLAQTGSRVGVVFAPESNGEVRLVRRVSR